MPAPVLQFKRGNAGVAGTVPALRPGEPAISLNNFDLFIGIDTSVANNKFFGSHRYWEREDGTNSSKLKLVSNNGSQSINLRAPTGLGATFTYTFPATGVGNSGKVLTTNESGQLSWVDSINSLTIIDIVGGIGTFYNDVGFTSTTNNVLGNENTGAVQIDGGVGIAKNLTVKENFYVGGNSQFVGSLDINGDLDVAGNVYIGGTTVTLRGTDVYIENKDIILGYTTSITPNDNTANHAGVAIASTVGSPLVSFSASGINTLPDTYKQMMWFKSGTLGFSTDAFGFNYGVAIGTTTMADGVRLAVGSGITMSDTTITASNFYGTFNGTTSTATRATTVDTTSTSTNTNYHLVFTDNATSTNSATMRVDAGIYYNPSSNYLFSSLFVGDVAAGIIKAADTTTAMTLANSTGNVTFNGDIQIGGNDIKASDGTTALTLSTSTGNVAFQGKVIANSYRSSINASDTLTFSDLDATFARNLVVTGITTTGTFKLSGTSGIGITGISASTSLAENSDNYLPTQKAVKAYVDAVDVTLGLNADSGGPSTVNTSQTLTISGTASEVETSVSGQTVTIGLPNDVVVGTSLSAPTLRTGTIQSSNTGATAITIVANDVTIADDLTVQGNLYVNGNTTQVNTTSITVEDRTIELGVVDGSAPSSSTTWDLGVFFNYYTDAAKKSAVVWEHSDSRFKFGSVVTDGGGSGNNNPQLTVSTFAPIEVGELWINNSCTGGSAQVIGCVGSELQLQNITIDAGTF
jgi:predicted acyltransferase (DUF342 family)